MFQGTRINIGVLKLFFLLGLLVSSNAWSYKLTADQVNGIYNLAQPERSAAGQTSKLLIQVGQNNGQVFLATAGCERCPPALYSYQKELTDDLERPVFYNSMGIYVISFDENTFVSVMPDGMLGKQIWKNLTYINVYAKQGSQGISLEKAKEFALAQSTQIMTGGNKKQPEPTAGNGLYYSAANHKINGTGYDKFTVIIEERDKIALEGKDCRSCTSDVFKYNKEISEAIGKPAYEMGNNGRFMIQYKPGVLLWVREALGKSTWRDSSKLNVFSNSQTYVRKLLTNEEQQNALFSVVSGYADIAKAGRDRRFEQKDRERTARNTLPPRGMNNSQLNKEVLAAAKNRAARENWNEKIIGAYVRGNDWTILRNEYGIQTGRYIPGVIVMKRKDGLCSYQAVHFGQQYNDIDYQKAYVYSIDSGQEKLDCRKVK